VLIKPSVEFPGESVWVNVYDYRESHLNAFRKEIASFPWHTFYRTSASIDEKCELFYKVVEIARRKIPSELVEMKPGDKPWITPTLKSLIEKRFQAYRSQDFKLYYHYKEKVRKGIKEAKQHWVSTKCKAPNGLWSVVNNVMNRNVRPSMRKITDSYPSLTEAANAINEEFRKNYSDSPDWATILSDTQRHLEVTAQPTWTVHIHVKDVLKLLLRLNTSKASGSDGLHPKLIKAAAYELAEPLAHLFAVSIETGAVPKKWKLAHVIPVPKTKKPTINTLRPISLLPVFSKLLEKLVLGSVLPNLIRLYGSNQFGFRPATSTLHAHIFIHDYITRLLDRDETAGVIMTTYDMSKAFDRLKHDALLRSLRDSDLPKGFIFWCIDFLRGRKQQVRISHALSSLENVTSGIPQGSVIAPYLFAAHMGKLKPYDGGHLTTKYADDIVTLIPFHPTSDVSAIVNDKVLEMEFWCSNHGLVLNVNKTKSMLIRKTGVPTAITTTPDTMNRTELHILGITYQSNLSWASHVNSMCKKASQRLFVLRKLKHLVGRRDLLKIYKALIMSIFDYCCPLFVGINKQEEDKIDSLTKRCHRIICGHECKCDILTPLGTRRNHLALKIFKKMTTPDHILHHLLPEVLPRTTHYSIPYCRTKRRQKSFIPYCTQLYNMMIPSKCHT
jgi:hypothetical protein